MPKYIMSVETVKIKDFIFSTNKMKVIEGASFLLDYLNQVEVPRILQKNEVQNDNIIYIGAGNAKFFVDTIAVAEKIGKEIVELYEREAPGAKIVFAYREKNKKLWDVMEELAQEIAVLKNEGFLTKNIDLPFFERCELSMNEAAEVSADFLKEDMRTLEITADGVDFFVLEDQIRKLAKKTGKISEETLRKMIYSNYMISNSFADRDCFSFYHLLTSTMNTEEEEAKKRRKNWKNKIDQYNIDELKNEDSFIGLMYSDGDGLGDFLKHVCAAFKNRENGEDEYLDFLKDFSKTLDKNTKISLKEAVEEVFSEVEREDSQNKKDSNRIMGKFLIVGGDDVCAVFHPSLVLKISALFQRKFEDKMYRSMQKYNHSMGKDIKITSSSGVIIAKVKTPMFQLFEQALKLQKNAKKKRHEIEEKYNKVETGFIDFQVIGSEGCVDILNYRKIVSPVDNRVMDRPYAINIDDPTILEAKDIEKLSTIIRILKKEKFPKTKLRAFYDLKRSNHKLEEEKKWEFIDIMSKMKEKDRKLLEKYLSVKVLTNEGTSFHKVLTNILDILEMYDFVDGDKYEN